MTRGFFLNFALCRGVGLESVLRIYDWKSKVWSATAWK